MIITSKLKYSSLLVVSIFSYESVDSGAKRDMWKLDYKKRLGQLVVLNIQEAPFIIWTLN